MSIYAVPLHNRPKAPSPQATISPAVRASEKFRTFAGTITSGMHVLDANDRVIGTVDRVESDHIVLASADGSAQCDYFVPLSLIDGIHGNNVLLAGRGDSSFGLGAQP